ncbi:MAG: hypothetical protein ACXWQO_19200 [Bdellovibrionota bacterium]
MKTLTLSLFLIAATFAANCFAEGDPLESRVEKKLETQHSATVKSSIAQKRRSAELKADSHEVGNDIHNAVAEKSEPKKKPTPKKKKEVQKPKPHK